VQRPMVVVNKGLDRLVFRIIQAGPREAQENSNWSRNTRKQNSTIRQKYLAR
jgi:hypothetical protein